MQKVQAKTNPVAPCVGLATGGHRYSFRIPCSFDGKDGPVVLDQLRTVDRERLVKRLGVLPEKLCYRCWPCCRNVCPSAGGARQGLPTQDLPAE